MSFGLTPQGFNRKLESDIMVEMVADVAPLFGIDPSTVEWPTTASPTSQFLSPFARQLGLVWELMEILSQAGDPLQASGTLFDAMLALNNLQREEATLSEVLAAISGIQGTVIVAGTLVAIGSTGDLFKAKANATITNAALLRFNIQVANVSNIGTPYVVTLNAQAISSGALGGSPSRDTIAHQLLNAINASSLVNQAVEAVFYGSAVVAIATVTSLLLYRATIDGVACDYTSDASATNQEIVDGIVAAINNGQSNLVALGLTSASFSLTHRIPGSDWKMTLSSAMIISTLSPIGAFAVKAQDLATAFSGSVEARMAIDKLFSPQTYQAIEAGPVEAPAGTLTVIQNPVAGFQAVTNFLDATLGRDVEEDDEGRVRRQETLSTGAGHSAAILSQLKRSVVGLTLARVYENINDNPDSEGRPGHSVEVMAVGGADLDVAEAIWATRASGIKPFGNVNADGSADPDGDGTGITIQDSNGINQVIHFSRPETLYGFIHATKTLYGEEEFPENGDDAIAAALLAYGNGLTIGKDLINQRFVGAAITIPGIGSLAITIAISHDPDNAPIGNNNPVSGDVAFTAANIAVGTRQRVLFDSSRITVS